MRFLKRLLPMSLIGVIMSGSMCEFNEEFDITEEIIFIAEFPFPYVRCTCVERKTRDEGELGYEKADELKQTYTQKGKRCEEFGYTFVSPYPTPNYEGPNDGTQPGTGGYFANLLTSGNPGNSTLDVFCKTAYVSPTSDVQLNSLCQTAYLYYCSGNKSQGDFTCSVYKSIPQSGTTTVQCSYCD